MDRLTTDQRHKNMKSIKSKDTRIERILRKALRDRGYGYRKNYSLLPGCPDIVMTKYRIAIFCDSEFFHGKDWERLKPQLERGNNADFWVKKIMKNMARDAYVNRELFCLNWTVVRFWGDDIKKHLDKCIRTIEEAIFEATLNEINIREEIRLA